MSQTPGSFRPSELEGAERPQAYADRAGAFSMARELEAARSSETIAPSADFADRVMAAIALEPTPRPAGFLDALRARPGLAGLTASVREAWAVVGDGPGRPMRARGLALAYVFAILVIGTSLTGVAAYGAAGALGLLDGDASPSPSVQETVAPPSPTPNPSSTPALTPSPTPTESSEPSESVEPTESPEPDESSEPDGSDDQSGASPAASAESSPDPSDDDDTSSPDPSPDDDDSSAEPSDTPGPSEGSD